MKKLKIPSAVWMSALVLAIMLLTAWLTQTAAAVSAGQHLASEVMRLHVIANSDSEEDQDLKRKVRDAVVEELEPLLSGVLGLPDLERILSENLADIQNTAQAVVTQEGYSYEVKAVLSNAWFPEKAYGDSVFPAGRYSALRIQIGQAKGQNWWCLLFPAGCFADCVRGVFPEEQKKALEGILTAEEYESLFSWKSNFKICTRWFSRE